jgi:hypothetical protein
MIITEFFRDQSAKSSNQAAMVTDGDCSSNSGRSSAREVAGSDANERGRRGDSNPYLTYRGDASWRSNFAGEVAPAGLFLPVSFLFVLAALFLGAAGTRGGLQEEGVARLQGGGRGCRAGARGAAHGWLQERAQGVGHSGWRRTRRGTLQRWL